MISGCFLCLRFIFIFPAKRKQ